GRARHAAPPDPVVLPVAGRHRAADHGLRHGVRPGPRPVLPVHGPRRPRPAHRPLRVGPGAVDRAGGARAGRARRGPGAGNGRLGRPGPRGGDGRGGRRREDPPRPPHRRTGAGRGRWGMTTGTEAATLPAEGGGGEGGWLAGPHQVQGHGTNTGLSNEKLAMWAVLGSECLLFGALISTYFLYRGRSLSGPTPKEIYDIPYTSVSSFVLLMSSLTMVLALAAIQRGDGRRLRVWLLATAFLGSSFISGQVYEFTSFIREG